MAITTIDNLQEIQSAGANDVLPISTANGVKKIKASALGGGGSFVGFTVSATGTYSGEHQQTTLSSITLTTENTMAELLTEADDNILGLRGKLTAGESGQMQYDYPCLIEQQAVVSAEALAQMGITSDTSGIVLAITSWLCDGNNVYKRFLNTFLIYSSSGEMVISDMTQ